LVRQDDKAGGWNTTFTVTANYDRYRYDKKKRAALEKWAGVL